MTFTERNNKHLLKDEGKILGYVTPTKGGYGLAFGKPSQKSVLVFEPKEGNWTLAEAKKALKERLGIIDAVQEPMYVNVSNRGNILRGQDPSKPLFGTLSDGIIKIDSLEEASLTVKSYIDQYDLGSSQWYGGEVFLANGKMIAYVSYNGRVWSEGDESFTEAKMALKRRLLED